MSRRLKQTFHCKPLDGLTRELLFSPPDKRIQQIRRIEQLHDQLDAKKNYPLDFIFYRITSYRREGKDAVMLPGDAVLPDLRLMIDTLSRSVRLTVTKDEAVETVEALAQRLNVSTKTIGRWRKMGMRWRWVQPEKTGRRTVVVPRAASDRFIQEHPELVSKAAAFTNIPPADRQRLITRARRLARRRDVSLNQVAAHLASRTGRALQTVRHILEKHDNDHPEQAVFTDHTPPITGKQRRLIARAYRMGVPAERIAARFNRSRSTVYRALHQHRAGKAERIPLDFVTLPTFARDDADEVILGRPLEEISQPHGRTAPPVDDLPEPVRILFDQPAYKPEQVRTLLVRYHYLNYRAQQVRDGFDRYSPAANQVDRFEVLIEQAQTIRGLLVRIHLPVVLSVSRRHLIGDETRGVNRLVDLLELGLGVLIQAVQTFPIGRTQQFDSFLTNRLLARFAAEPGLNRAATPQAQRRLKPGDALRRLTTLAQEAGVPLQEETTNV